MQKSLDIIDSARLITPYYLNFDQAEIEGEEWRDHPRLNGLYMVSSFGRIKSYPKIQNGYTWRIRKQGIDNRGYLRVCLGCDSEKTTDKVHRLVAEVFVPNPENKPEVNHDNGLKFCNYFKNLFWTDRAGNMRHAFDSGLCKPRFGEENGFSKLSDKQVLEIFNSPEPAGILAIKNKITAGTVYDIKSGRIHWLLTGIKKNRKTQTR